MIYIYGNGAFGCEVMAAMKSIEIDFDVRCQLMADDQYCKPDEKKLSEFNGGVVIIAHGDGKKRLEMLDKLPENTVLPWYNMGKILNEDTVKIGRGTIIQPGAILTTDIEIGCFVLINLNVTIGHNCKIGDFVTISPGANISGNVSIGNFCTIGSNAVIREKITICDNVTIGAGAVVVQDITEQGTYVGNPVRKLTT